MQQRIQIKKSHVFGVWVKSFPEGIKTAFIDLMERFGNERLYYGISWLEGDLIKYYAMVSEDKGNEANHADYKRLVIEEGEYLTETVFDWQSKTLNIKEIFHGLMGEQKPSKTHPFIEWYKSDDEMLCMIKNRS